MNDQTADETARAILLHLKMPERDFEETVMQVSFIISKHLPSPQGEPVGELIIRDGIVSFHTLIPIERLISGQLFAAPGSAPGYVPPDYVMVPREPTEAMCKAAYECGLHGGGPKEIYKTMLFCASLTLAPAPVPWIAELKELEQKWRAEADRLGTLPDVGYQILSGNIAKFCDELAALVGMNRRIALRDSREDVSSKEPKS